MATNTDEREEIKPVAPTEQTKWRDPSLVGKYMVDPKTGLAGLFRSPDNGETWVLTDTVYGHVYSQDEVDNIWDNGAGHKVADEIKSTTADLPNVRKQADSAVKFAESAIAASKVNSDAIVAQSEAISEAKSAMDSATAEIQQLKANAASDVAQIESTIAEVQTSINQAKSANESATQAVQAELKSTSDAMDKVEKQLNEVGTSLDTYAKSAAEQGHDITVIKQKQGQFEADFASVQGNVNQIQADIKGLRQNIKDNQGNIASLLTSADKLQASMTDAEKNISNLLLTASKYEQTFKDQDGRLSKVEQTATEHTSELADTKGNLDKVTQKADNLQLLLSDAQKNIQKIQLDAEGLHDTLTGQSNQLASLNVTLNNLDSKYSGITGDLQSKQTALSTEQQQTKDMLLRKADKSEVDNVKGTVNQVSAEQKTMADQINQKVSSTEYQILKDKVNNLQVGGDNLISDGDASAFNATPWGNTNFGKHEFYYNGTKNMFVIATSAKTELTSGSNWFPVKAGQQYTLYFNGFMSYNVSSYDVWLLGKPADKDGSWSDVYQIINGQRLSSSKNCIVTKTFTVPNFWNNYVACVRFDNNGSTDGQNSLFFFNEISLKEGNVNTGYSASPNDAIALIKKNVTAIDQTNKAITLKADQTEVNNVKSTAQQLSSRLDMMAGEIKSKVTSTDVNNIVDGKGYATTSTVQSLVDQKAGTINENITNLDAKYSAKDGVNLATETGNVSLSGGYNSNKNIGDISLDVINELRGKYMTISVDVEWNGWESGADFNRLGWEIQLIYEDGSPADYYGAWLTPTTANGKQRISGTYMVPDKEISSLAEGIAYIEINCTSAKVSCLKIERGTVATPWTPAPSDNATVTQLQSVTASIDGLQSNVTNFKNDTSSQITQLSNVIQSKVSASDFNDLKDKTTWKSTDNIDLNTAVSQQKIFVTGGSNLPPGGYWWYVQVEPGYDSRIVQYAVSDRDNIHYSRQYDGSKWSAWSQGATESEITQLRDDINLRVKSGDLLSQINLTAGNTLIQSNKLYLDASSVVFSGRAFIPSAAIASLSADKINTGTLNTDKISLSNGHVRLSSDDDHFYVQTEENAVNNPTTRFNFDGIDFMDSSYGKEVPQYSIGYDTSSADRHLYINAFDHFNSGGTTASQLWYSMVPAISLNNQEINFAAKGNMHMQVVDGGVNIKPTLFFQNNTNNGTYTGFTRLDNSNTVEFNTGDNNGENFHVNSGARFMKYVYFNDYCRAQGWLTYSTLSKKTNIKKLDTSLALDKIRQDDQYLYEYKRNVEQGIYDPQASFIIDDVNDVSHYSVPREFIDQTGKYREPSVELSYLIAAFQEIDKQVQTQKEEIKELKEKLQHE